jgi:DnaJ-class molecular chaperone
VSAAGAQPGPLVLVLAAAPHAVYRRRGASDLAAAVRLPLVNALTGGCVRLDTLDGRWGGGVTLAVAARAPDRRHCAQAGRAVRACAAC